MREDYPRRTTSAVVWLIALLTAAFVMELALRSPWFGSEGILLSQLQLTVRGIQNGHFWTLVTHGFLSNAGGSVQLLPAAAHFLFAVLGLVFFGRELETLLGARRFLVVYLGALILGGLSWSAVHWTHGGIYIGASAGILGLFVALAGIYPNQEIGFYGVPVTVRLKYLALALLGVEAIGLIFYELGGNPAPFDPAPSAHLGGMLAGWLYFRFFHANNGWDRADSIELPAWLRRNAPPAAILPPAAPKPDQKPPNLRIEVDRILDKINSDGFGALTDEEKRVLDEAKDLLSRP